MSKSLGVDGCRFGWVVVAEEGGELTYRILPSMQELLAKYPHAEFVAVDIPIGLPWRGYPVRQCDILARSLLGPRASSVFPVPCRKACAAHDIQDARRWNLDELGRSLSAQTFGICRKIAEVDQLLAREARARRVMREMHPELAFWGLNGRRPMEHSKRTAAGIAQRLEVLTKYEPRSRELLDRALAEQRRRDLQADDLLDALVGFVVARVEPGCIESLCGTPALDERGLPMEMVYVIAERE